MKIQLTKGQYRDLVILTELARHIVSSVSDGAPSEEFHESTQRIQELRDVLLRHAYDFECDDMVTTGGDTLTLRDAFHTYVDNLLSEYDESIFWDELASRLGERDAYANLSADDQKRMEEDTLYRLDKIEEYGERYADEFETNGLKRLKIQK